MSNKPRTCESPHVWSAWSDAKREDNVPRLMRVCYLCETIEWEDDPWTPQSVEAA